MANEPLYQAKHEYLQRGDSYYPGIRILECNYEFEIKLWVYRNCNFPYWMLWRNDDEGGILQFNGRPLPLEPGKIILIPPHTSFSTDTDGRRFSQFYIHFQADVPFNRVRKCPLILDGGTCAGWIGRIQRREDSRERIELMAFIIIATVLLELPPDAFLGDEESTLCRRIEQALDFINRNSGSSPTNQQIAHEIKMSVNNFLKLFKEQLGVSPRQYLLAQKIQNGRILLQNPALSIDEIAERTGFNDRYHFTKTFKRLTRLSPGEYRKQSRLY